RQEKERLIKEKKIKRDKNASIIYRGEDNSYYEKMLATGEVKCIDEEIPFDVPNGWKWCRLSALTTRFSTGPFGTMLHKEDYTDNGVAVINPTNIINHKISINNIKQISLAKAKELQGYAVCKGDIILARRGDLRKSAIITDFEDSCIAGTGSFIFHLLGIVNSFFILFYISPYVQDYLITDSIGTTMNNLNQKLLSRLLIPIPPRAEQVRIVSLVDELFSLVNTYDMMKNKLDFLNSSLHENIKKSILQEAIQGKLVPQIAEEGTAKELLELIKTEKQKLVKEGKLKKSALNDSVIFKGDDNKYYEQIGKKCLDITDEIPFVIPETWQWVRIRDVFQLNPKNEAEDEKLVAFIPMEKISASYKSDFTFDTTKWGTIKKGFTHFANGDVAFAKITPCFQNRKSAIFHDLPNGIGAGTTELKVLRPYGNTIDRWYLLYFLESPYFIDEATFKGTANQQRIVVGYLEDKLFPLPTQKEQQRIVAQIEKLFEQLH
uniref:restriction endonuclease subunit S n=2 Tax=Prevotella sp. TaxID=59823 RepID=UPI0027E3933A